MARDRPLPLALVLGDVDLVRPLGLAGVPCALFALDDDPARRSRHVRERLPWIDHWTDQERMVESLLAFAGRQPEPPVLFPQTDGDLLALSRHRDRLDGPFRMLLAEPGLVEACLDKSVFSRLAAEHDLPVPAAVRLDGACAPPGGLRFPVVVKPVTRHQERWEPLGGHAKAISLQGPDELDALVGKLARLRLEVVVQEAVPGPEAAIESHHAYVDRDGALVADVTGRKLRTYPARYGHSTAVEITDRDDVRALGRSILARLDLRGFAKLDFKRRPDGELRLLEINPRATLWHHPAALAGANLAALAYADLTGRPRPALGAVRSGVRWCQPLADRRAASEAGIPLRRWLRFVASCEARSGFAADDPLPLVGTVALGLRRRLLGR